MTPEEREYKLVDLAVNQFCDTLPEVEYKVKPRWRAYYDDVCKQKTVYIEIEYECLYPEEMIELGKAMIEVKNKDCVIDLYCCGGERGVIVLGITVAHDRVEELTDE
jgi:hypothetical protein